jgi:hypothetical protein
MDGRSGVVKAGTRTTAREVQGAAIMDDRTNLTSQGRKRVLVHPDADIRDGIARTRGAAIKDDRKKHAKINQRPPQ